MRHVTAQSGIFALGTAEHCYLELRLRDGVAPGELVRRLAGLTEPLTTVGGVNVVVGLRPSLWRAVAPDATPAGAPTSTGTSSARTASSCRPPSTTRGCGCPARTGRRSSTTPAASSPAVQPVADVAQEMTGWLYRSDRDLTGFIDGTENPSVREAPAWSTVPDGVPGAGASIVLHQLWRHDTGAWEGIGDHRQELAMGRTKPDSIELDAADMPAERARRPHQLRAATARSRTSSAATSPTAASPTTGRCSSASRATSGGWRRCCAGWPASATACGAR